VKGRNLIAYPEAEIRLAVSRAVALETTRGWRITKEKVSHKIDVVVALAMAALWAVQQGQQSTKIEVMTAPNKLRRDYVLGSVSVVAGATRELEPYDRQRLAEYEAEDRAASFTKARGGSGLSRNSLRGF
jgi:hypothetical protein